MHPSLQNMYISEFLSICAASTLMKFSTMIAFVLSDTSCYAVTFCLFWLDLQGIENNQLVFICKCQIKMCCSVAWCYFEHHLFQVG